MDQNRHTHGDPDNAGHRHEPHSHSHHPASTDSHHDHDHGSGLLARIKQFLHLEHHHRGPVDADLAMNSLGMRAVMWSFGGLMVTALIQVVIDTYTGSAARPA